jgi:ABC-type ATPase involved in cell division
MFFSLQNLGIIKEATLEISKLTLISGKNGQGKSFLVRMIYAILTAYRQFLNTQKINGEGLQTHPIFIETLSAKLISVFQQKALSALVNNTAHKVLKVKVDDFISFSITQDSTNQIQLETFSSTEMPYQDISLIFLSSVLDIELALSNYKEYYKNHFGVSDVYWDVLSRIRNIGVSPEPELNPIYSKIAKIIDGQFEYSPQQGSIFQSKGKAIDTKLSASGLKIFGLLQLLIERNILKKEAVLILEEPESHLHPFFSFKLIEILFDLKKAGVVVILVTHNVEIIRYIEYLINTRQENLTDFTFALFEPVENFTVLSQSKDIQKLQEIMQVLTEDYFHLIMREENYFES